MTKQVKITNAFPKTEKYYISDLHEENLTATINRILIKRLQKSPPFNNIDIRKVTVVRYSSVVYLYAIGETALNTRMMNFLFFNFIGTSYLRVTGS